MAAGERLGFRVERSPDHVGKTAQLLAENWVGAIFYGAMEMGPRALGVRSILANPVQRKVNDSINKRLQRTEFMPFALFVLDVDDEFFAFLANEGYTLQPLAERLPDFRQISGVGRLKSSSVPSRFSRTMSTAFC